MRFEPSKNILTRRCFQQRDITSVFVRSSLRIPLHKQPEDTWEAGLPLPPPQVPPPGVPLQPQRRGQHDAPSSPAGFSGVRATYIHRLCIYFGVWPSVLKFVRVILTLLTEIWVFVEPSRVLSSGAPEKGVIQGVIYIHRYRNRILSFSSSFLGSQIFILWKV